MWMWLWTLYLNVYCIYCVFSSCMQFVLNFCSSMCVCVVYSYLQVQPNFMTNPIVSWGKLYFRQYANGIQIKNLVILYADLCIYLYFVLSGIRNVFNQCLYDCIVVVDARPKKAYNHINITCTLCVSERSSSLSLVLRLVFCGRQNAKEIHK